MEILATYTYTSGGAEYSFGFWQILSWVVLAVLIIAGMWKTFQKAGRPGWAALIPVYNTLVILWIAGRPWWWIFAFLLAIIPFVGWIVALVVAVIVFNDISKKFGRGVGTTLLLLFLPFIGWPILGFGDTKYKSKGQKISKSK